MRRVPCEPRPDWPRIVESQGFLFHTTEEEAPYWDESAYYEFTRAEIDELETATYALNEICLQAVQRVFDEGRLDEFHIPDSFHDWLHESWQRDEKSIYGRFDLLCDGRQPPKLAEYNADTPTALLEAAVIQWYWLQDRHPNADQFNSIHERLLEIWKTLAERVQGRMFFTSIRDSLEDYMTVNYLRDVAIQAGLQTEYIDIADIGWNEVRGAFVDVQERPIQYVFKLYPWEWLIGEEFGAHLLESPIRWWEPPWKMLLSNKAILPILHEYFPEHPNLLPAAWQPLDEACVKKPIWGREGSNIQVLQNGHVTFETDGDYDSSPMIYQRYHPTATFDERSIVVGSWIINGFAAGIGIREDDSIITRNTSRFVPHRMV